MECYSIILARAPILRLVSLSLSLTLLFLTIVPIKRNELNNAKLESYFSPPSECFDFIEIESRDDSSQLFKFNVYCRRWGCVSCILLMFLLHDLSSYGEPEDKDKQKMMCGSQTILAVTTTFFARGDSLP